MDDGAKALIILFLVLSTPLEILGMLIPIGVGMKRDEWKDRDEEMKALANWRREHESHRYRTPRQTEKKEKK